MAEKRRTLSDDEIVTTPLAGGGTRSETGDADQDDADVDTDDTDADADTDDPS